MKKKPEKFSNLMERLARRHGLQSIFSDFLTMLICAFSHGKMEEQYLSVIRKYEKPEAYQFSEALAALVIEMTGDGTGMVDVLGAFFEEHLSFGKNGQFFTPQPICDMMAQMTGTVLPWQKVADPACGSGRMLLAMGKLQRFALFYGADNDINCAKMTTINLCLNGMFGEVAWMNSLSNDYYGGWEIFPAVKGCPCIREISEKESYIHLKLPDKINKPGTDIPNIEISVPTSQIIQPTQGLLFEF